MLSKSQRSLLLVIALALFIPVAILQTRIDPLRHQYEPKDKRNNEIMSKLPIEFALPAIVGFREAAAGLLWVRTDEFFHEGNYEAITPMIRLITWLDPHQIDVYETGAWHMDYNFTDQDQRSDRRYIPLAIALMEEGISNNSDVPDMYSDLGFTHYYRKIADFHKAAYWFQHGQDVMDQLQRDAVKEPTDFALKDSAKAASYAVTTTSHGLAHCYEALGMIPEAEKQWKYCIAAHTKNIADDTKHENTFGEQTSLNTSVKQLYEMQQRAKWRTQIVKNPIDVQFDAQLRRVAPKVFVISGQFHAIGASGFNLETGKVDSWGPVDGCRIDFRLEDQGYKMPVLTSFTLNTLNLNPDTTIMQDSGSVRDGKFSRKVDMSKDPAIYSFKAPKYTVTIWFNPASPQNCPPQVHDRIGWIGEGMTDKRYLDLTGKVPGDVSEPIKGLRMVKKTFTLTREDILGNGEKVFN